MCNSIWGLTRAGTAGCPPPRRQAVPLESRPCTFKHPTGMRARASPILQIFLGVMGFLRRAAKFHETVCDTKQSRNPVWKGLFLYCSSCHHRPRVELSRKPSVSEASSSTTSPLPRARLCPHSQQTGQPVSQPRETGLQFTLTQPDIFPPKKV